jgi:hypothetical protein
VVARILSAYAIGLVVSLFADGDVGKAIMFFVGFMPESALVWLREQVAQDSGPLGALPLHEPSPLTELEGIDLYDRTRLAEEGISNVEALAHADIVDLMSSTRISAAELVDWTDQALLYLRVGGDAHAQCDPDDAGAEPPPNVRRNLGHLRSFGIRTATDLVQVYEQALRRGTDPFRRAAEVKLLRDALDLPDAPHRTEVRTIQTIIDTLADEEWFVQVRNWRNPEFGAIDAWYWYLDGQGWTPRRTIDIPQRVKRAMTPLRSVHIIADPPTDQRQSA